MHPDLVEGPLRPEAPSPGPGDQTFYQKLFAYPDWLWGIALGAVVATIMLVVILPRQEYARPVKAPDDKLLAEVGKPLAPADAAKLADARDQLASGKIDAAVLNLNTVLLVHPENQEARWLLAGTYDRLGDSVRAAKHYTAYLALHDRVREVTDARAAEARERLEHWGGTP